MSTHLPQRWGWTCSDCYSPARMRTSDGLHIHMRTLYIECTNLGCGAVFRGEALITHRMNSPAEPNPTVNLPLAPVAMRKKARADSLGETKDPQIDLLEEVSQ